MYEKLKSIALNLRSSWNHSSDAIWRRLNPELWEISRNPWAILQTASPKKLEELLNDPELGHLISELAPDTGDSCWYQSGLKSVAYFSMEFMLSEALPIYSGGLGNVAGDQLKAASDLGVPVTAIGLLYSRGYFRQLIDKNGEQQELYPYNDPGTLPIVPLRLPNGEWLRLKVELPGWSLWLRTWEVKVGNRTLYLLDSNDIGNTPEKRSITSELYGGNKELRLRQELILGIGGWRLLEALGLEPDVCHLNEGHAAFVVLERTLSFMQKSGLAFDEALCGARTGNVFTTHTAVTAGFDRFSPELIEKYLGKYAEQKLGITLQKLLALGQLNPGDDFNMAYLAMRGSGFINGVSELHGKVSRKLFEDLFPRWPENEVPVGYVTNGVHMPSWDSKESDALWTEACGKGLWFKCTEDLKEKIRRVPEEKIWRMRCKSRAHLINYARERLARQLAEREASEADIERVKTYLDPNALTLGFARRFATYKRPTLLLHDQERLVRLLKNKDRPLQLIIAGKAHPADREGHVLIKKWMDFILGSEVRSHVVFLSDYDMILTEHLVQGVDLWVNTPRRPWEACGTSGMKVLVNGGLNLSELDGWWAEAYSPEVGFALGNEGEGNVDADEATALYDLLENEVIPEFYTRDERNIPFHWTQKIKESMALLTPHFSSNRAVREYAEKYYFPASKAYHERTANNGAKAKGIVSWARDLENKFKMLRFGSVKVQSDKDFHLFEVEVFLGDLDRTSIKVELYSEVMTLEMEYTSGSVYSLKIPALQNASFFIPRIIPYYPGVAVPLEAHQILWQR